VQLNVMYHVMWYAMWLLNAMQYEFNLT